jgi:hypothetical protein
MMWQHRELQDHFRRSGLNEAHFYTSTGTLASSARSVRSLKSGSLSGGGVDHYSPLSESVTVNKHLTFKKIEKKSI